MVARFLILLPFDLFITDAELWPSVEGTVKDYRVKVYPPMLYAERPKPTDSVHAHVSWAKNLSPPSFSENVLQNDRKTAHVNVLTLDFIKPEFDRSISSVGACDPAPELAFEVANSFLARIRVYSRAPQIRPLVRSRDPWKVSYLSDDFRQLEVEEGKHRGRLAATVSVGNVALTPETIRMVADRWQSAEPYVWDELLLDAHALWPDVGSAIVMAYAALETFIEWALEILQEERKLPGKFWKWIKERDHWTKEPSVAEQFDALLFLFTERSLKDEPTLWGPFTELKKARNTLVHAGTANVGGEAVAADKAKELIDNADKIIAWVEALLPEKHRRGRTAAEGPFTRRIATPDEAATLGSAHIKSGQPGPLKSGAGIVFGFDEPRPGEEPELDDSPPPDITT
jgi:hypothetical protein